jgi:threonylcarbamoyladenosine tRNA methylthiotransferase MtaB
MKENVISTVGLATLGCKVNQCDSAALACDLAAAGFILAPFSGPADAYIINTCTVTAFADFQARQLIRRAHRANPRARILVTGCYAQTQARALAALDHVSYIVGNDAKHRIPELLCAPVGTEGQKQVGDIFSVRQFFAAPVAGPANRTRAFFKIQDGCDAFCSYCIVPFARGKSRSLSLDGFFPARVSLQPGATGKSSPSPASTWGYTARIWNRLSNWSGRWRPFCRNIRRFAFGSAPSNPTKLPMRSWIC